MDEAASSSNTPNETTTSQQNAQVLATPPDPRENAETTTASPAIAESTEVAASEHRQAYGTAKTENLRDSGAWRIILPAFVVLLCLALLAVPLIILISLLVTSFSAAAPTHGLIWLWIVMIILEVAVAAIIIRGLTKIFMTQAGNYRS